MSRDWREDGSCASMDPDLFFPDTGDVEYAKKVCRGCPVREVCLKEALHLGVDYGVRGGHNLTTSRTAAA